MTDSFIPDLSSFRMPQLPRIKNPAEWAHERIVKSIIKFEAKLDENHEIGARLVAFASTEVFHIEDVGYWGPDMLKFYGHNVEGQPVELIQHISQLSVLLVAMKKQHDKPRRIGFGLAKHLSSDSKE